MFKKILLFCAILFTSHAYANDYLDTQYGDDELALHIIKISFYKEIMTIVFKAENTGDEEKTYKSIKLDDLYFNTGDKKYSVLRVKHGSWVASVGERRDRLFAGISSGSSEFTLKAKAKKMGWVKFKTPKESDWPVEMNIPGFAPFVLNKPE